MEATFDGKVETISRFWGKAPGLLIQIKPNGDLERFTEMVHALKFSAPVRIHMILLEQT